MHSCLYILVIILIRGNQSSGTRLTNLPHHARRLRDPSLHHRRMPGKLEIYLAVHVVGSSLQ